MSEVAPSIPNGDFIEIFSSVKTNLNLFVLMEGGKVIKKFPNVTLNQGAFGSYLILHASEKVSENNVDESDLSGDINQNGIVDLYSDESSPGLTGGACDNLTFKSNTGEILDFISWSVALDPYPTSIQASYVQASSSTIWFPPCELGQVSCFQSGSLSWNNKSSQSIQRKIGPNGMPLQQTPSSANDWQIGPPSPGNGYSKSIQAVDSLLEIFQSPFSPYSDGPYREALISYKVSAQSIVSIHIYNLHGSLIRTISEEIVIPSHDIQVTTWDGKDENGENVPIGIYLVQIVEKELNGNIRKEVKAVIIARKL